MALPDYFKSELGTPIVWGPASGSGVTNTLSLDSLASAAGRMGVGVDLGATFDQDFLLLFRLETGTAPAAGAIAECYLAFSSDNTIWPGSVSGADAAYPATIADNKKQLGAPASILVATATANAIQIQNPVLIRPAGRYVAPVVVNLLGFALRAVAPAANNLSRVILVPVRNLIQDGS